jgi:hypothetical protein
MGVYEYDALGTLQSVGITHLKIWCVRLPCTNWRTVAIADLIQRFGPTTSLVMVARRVRCKTCKAKGGQVQPDRPDPHGDGASQAKLAVFSWARAS